MTLIDDFRRISRDSWREDALCRHEDPEIWWIDYENDDPDDREHKAKVAKKICAECPVLDHCAVYGLRLIEDRWSVLGGLTHRERLEIRRKLGWKDGVGR